MNGATHDPLAGFTLCCLRARFDPAALDDARAAAPALDWEAWLPFVQFEALTPLLYRILQGCDFVPTGVAERLQDDYFRTARDNALYLRALAHSLAALATAGVPVIVLKGAALAETVYANLALRPMVDLDLLVHRPDAQAALDALAALGFAPIYEEVQTGARVTFGSEVALYKPGPPDTQLDLHWSLLSSTHYQQRLATDWFWATAVPYQVEGVASLCLGPEALLLHLCAHLSLHHLGEGLLWLHDVAEVVHLYHDRLDWEELRARAALYDLVLPLQQVLTRVARDWQAPIPAPVLQRLAALAPSATEAHLHPWITAAGWPAAYWLWANLAAIPGWRVRLRFGLAHLFPSAPYMRQRYGAGNALSLTLAYPYRWLLGAAGGLRAVWASVNQRRRR